MPQKARLYSIISLVFSLALAIGLGLVINQLETEKIKNERNRQGVELFYIALDEVNVPILTVTERGLIATWNKGARRQFGWDSKDVVGQELGFLMPSPEVSEKHSRAFRAKTIASHIQSHLSIRCNIRTKSGGEKPVVVMIYEADHPPSRYLAVLNPAGPVRTVK